MAGATLLALWALAGCGSDDVPGTAEPAAVASPAVASAPTPISVPWRLAGVDGVLLEVRVAGGGCVSFQNLDVAETATTVTIKATALKETRPGTFCSQEITTEQAPQSLDSPLGRRKLVHAPISPEWDGPQKLDPDRR